MLEVEIQTSSICTESSIRFESTCLEKNGKITIRRVAGTTSFNSQDLETLKVREKSRGDAFNNVKDRDRSLMISIER